MGPTYRFLQMTSFGPNTVDIFEYFVTIREPHTGCFI